MVETTPYNPVSKKGEIRARIATALQNEMNQGNINAIIARAADLYGPYAAKTSLPYVLVFDRLINGKKAQWLVDARKTHSYTYTLDSAEGLCLLAKNGECFNQVWHLPTCNPAPTGEQFIGLAAKQSNGNPANTILKKWMIQTSGFFNRTVAEAYEMLYQSEHDYRFDSAKFNHYFGYQPTTYEEGIGATVTFLRGERIQTKNDHRPALSTPLP